LQGQLIEVRRPVWISRISARGNSWQLSENGQSEGTFDAVVIAHNGDFQLALDPVAMLSWVVVI
jgi:predicted NAD/FAD-dependent oxidoreductase